MLEYFHFNSYFILFLKKKITTIFIYTNNYKYFIYLLFRYTNYEILYDCGRYLAIKKLK